MRKVATSSVDNLHLSQVHVDFEPWDNFCFCECENGHYLEETGKIIAFNELTSMAVRDIAVLLGGKIKCVKNSLCM
jgi:hypothetical protein